jgi:hypothetical protein
LTKNSKCNLKAQKFLNQSDKLTSGEHNGCEFQFCLAKNDGCEMFEAYSAAMEIVKYIR